MRTSYIQLCFLLDALDTLDTPGIVSRDPIIYFLAPSIEELELVEI